MRALARRPEDRYQTARQFSRALQQFLMTQGVFVGPEDVGDYINTLFRDRVAKREKYLEWAAEVTSNVDVDQLRAQQERDDSELDERRCRFPIDSLNREVAVCYAHGAEEHFGISVAGLHELLDHLDHAEADLGGDVQAAVRVGKIVSHALLSFDHSRVGALRVERGKLVEASIQ